MSAPARHLGEQPSQLTTVEDKLTPVPLDQIPFDDHPTITFNKHEAIEMPFRYVKDENGQPILPPGMREHLHADLNRTIDEF